MRVKISYKVYPHDRDALPRDPAWHISTRFRNVGTVGTRSRAIRGSTSDDRVGCQRLRGSIRSGASGVACLAPSFAISAMRARECRLYLGLSIIAPSVNVPGRTRRKPSTIRGAAPDVVIGQSTAAPAGARPYPSGGNRFARPGPEGCDENGPARGNVSAYRRAGVSAFAKHRQLRRELLVIAAVSKSSVPRRRYANTPTRRHAFVGNESLLIYPL